MLKTFDVPSTITWKPHSLGNLLDHFVHDLFKLFNVLLFTLKLKIK